MNIGVYKSTGIIQVPQANGQSYKGVRFRIRTDILKNWHPKHRYSYRDFLFVAMRYNYIDCDASTIEFSLNNDLIEYHFVSADISITEEEVTRAIVNHYLSGGCREPAITYTKGDSN